jgi:uncharacterized RDD family membrane protein YckC
MPIEVVDSPVDTVARIETPEHVGFEFRVAGPWRRGSAYLLDAIARVIVIVVAGIAVELLAASIGRSLKDVLQAQQALGLLLFFVIEWFYYVLFEWLWNGQTPGKRALGLRVVKDGGYPIGLQDALLRNLVRAADLMPPFLPLGELFPTYFVGVASSSADPRFRRLGDMVAGTIVIIDDRDRGFLKAAVPVEPPPTPAELAMIPPHPQLAIEERRTIEAFIRRFRTISPARREEICIEYAEVLARRLGAPPPRSGARFLQLVYDRLSQATKPFRRSAV